MMPVRHSGTVSNDQRCPDFCWFVCVLLCTQQELKAIENELSQAGPLSAVPSQSQSQARHMIGLGGLGDADALPSRGGAGMSAPLVHRSASSSRMAAAAGAVRRVDASGDHAAPDRGGARISEVSNYGEGCTAFPASLCSTAHCDVWT